MTDHKKTWDDQTKYDNKVGSGEGGLSLGLPIWQGAEW